MSHRSRSLFFLRRGGIDIDRKFYIFIVALFVYLPMLSLVGKYTCFDFDLKKL